MSPTLPPEIRVESGRHGTRYLLPPRETGPLKLVAVFFIGFGCLFGGFALFWILGVLGVSQKDGFQAGGVLFALFGVPFLGVGLGIVGLGTFMLCGRCEIEIQPGELIARERGGPFWWTRRIPLKDIQRFTLVTDAVRVNGQPAKSGTMADVGTLAAEVGAAKPQLVTMGYSRAWMECLATCLTADLAAQTGTPVPPPLAQTVTHTAADQVPLAGDRFDPPPTTTLRLTEQAGGIVAVVPPQGARSTRGLLAFAIVWLLFVAVIGAVALFAPEPQKRRRNQAKPLPGVVIGLFGLAGVGLLAGAVNQMRRKASLRASRTELIIVQQSLFGSRTFKHHPAELAAIRLGNSGLVINHVPVQELQVHTTDGKAHGFFSHLTTDELLWLATHLRLATGVGEVPGESSEPPKLAT